MTSTAWSKDVPGSGAWPRLYGVLNIDPVYSLHACSVRHAHRSRSIYRPCTATHPGQRSLSYAMRCAVSCRSLLAERTHHINSWFPGLAGLFPLAMVLRRRDQTDVTSGLDRSHLQRRRARSPSQAERRRTSAWLCAACPAGPLTASAARDDGGMHVAVGRSAAAERIRAGCVGAHGAVQLCGLRRSGGARARPS